VNVGDAVRLETDQASEMLKAQAEEDQPARSGDTPRERHTSL